MSIDKIRLSRKEFLLGMAATAVTPWQALAQSEADKSRIAALKPKDFPTEPIEITVTTPAGGGLDLTGRALAQYFEKYAGHRAIVNNRTGAAGAIGHAWLATQAPNDGSVIGIMSNTVLGDSIRAQGRWTYTDIEPLAFINYEPNCWIASTEGPHKDKSLKQLMDLAKANPGTVRFAVAANATILAEQMEKATGASLAKVPFPGSAPALTALLGGHIDVSFAYFSEFRSNLEAGKLRAIAVASSKRSPYMPDVPTINEALGSTGIERVVFRYVGTPKGMAAPKKAYLRAALEAALADPGLRAEYTKMGAILDESYGSPEKIQTELDRLFVIDRQLLTEDKK